MGSSLCTLDLNKSLLELGQHYRSDTLHPLIVGGLIKKRGLAIFPEEINREGGNKWKWVNFVMQCLNRGLSIVGAVALIFFKLC